MTALRRAGISLLSSLGCLAIVFAIPSAEAIAQSVLTQHNDNQRTGANVAETQLTPANVSRSFGHLYTLDVSGGPGKGPNTIGAQPLYVSRLMINGAAHEVLFVSTRQNWIFAYIVDGTAKPVLAWKTELRDPRRLGAEEMQGMDGRYQDDKLWDPDPQKQHLCGQTHGPVGISSTPVIDQASNTMWVVYRTSSPFGPAQYNAPPPGQTNGVKNPYDAKFWIRKLDIRTGNKLAEQEIKLPSSHPNFNEFDPNKIITRPGLLLLNGIIYMAFSGAVCDTGAGEPISWKPTPPPSTHGWILAIDANSLNLVSGVVTTPNSTMGGIWQSGSGLAADRQGSVFALTGNNEADNRNDSPTLNPKTEMSDAIIRARLERGVIGPMQLVTEHFTASNWYRLDTGARFPGDPQAYIPCQPVFACDKTYDFVAGDSDPASGGPVVLPNGMVLGGGKQGRFYLLTPENMTVRQSFQAFDNSWHSGISPCDYDQDQSFGPNIHGAPVVWHPDAVPYALVYHMPEKDYLKAFRAFDDGHMDERPFLATYDSGIRSARGMPGAALSLSASGGRDGILWVTALQQASVDGLNTDGDPKKFSYGRLMAFDALTLEKIWESHDPVTFAKYIPPTIGGGKVFRSAYSDQISVYGLGPTAPVGSYLNRKLTVPAGSVTRRLSLNSTRSVAALWRSADHLDLFMSARQDGRSVLSADWEHSCPSPPSPPPARGWRGWFPIDSNMDTHSDGQKLPTVYTFAASGAAPVTATLAPARNGVPNPHVDLFVADTNGLVMSNYWEPPHSPLSLLENGQPVGPPRWKGTGWRAWFPVGGTSVAVAPRQPITAVWRPGSNHLDLFTVGRDGRVMSTYFEGTQWQPAWFPIGGRTLAAPGQRVTALWRNANHLDLFIADKAGHVMSTYFDNNRWQPGWFAINPATVAAPGQTVTALWRNPNHLDLFMTDNAGHVMSTYFDNNKWQPAWFAINPASGAAVPGQTVTALWRNANHLDLFITSRDGRVISTYFDNNRWQQGWFAISPSTAKAAPGQEITALWAAGNNHLDLFITATDGRVMSIFVDNDQWATAWFAI